MSELQFMQGLIGSLFGLSLFVRMWQHSISTFIVLGAGTLSLFLYQVDKCLSVTIFSIAMIYVTYRGSMKPKGERLWR